MASEIDALIVNHTAADHYDYRDYNRVGAAVAYVAGLLNSTYGFNVAVTAKHDWTEADILTQSDIDRYLADVQTCRDALEQLASTPETPTVMRYNVDTANAIEKILMDVDTLLQSLWLVLQRAGQPLFFAGYGVYPASPGEPLLAEDTQEILAEDGTELFYY